MSMLFLTLDLAFPSVFLLLARRMRGKQKRVLILQCIFVLLLALLTAPIALIYFSLSAQGILCASLILIQGFLGSRALY